MVEKIKVKINQTVYVVYDPLRENVKSVHLTEKGAQDRCIELDKKEDRKSYHHEYEEIEIEK